MIILVYRQAAIQDTSKTPAIRTEEADEDAQVRPKLKMHRCIPNCVSIKLSWLTAPGCPQSRGQRQQARRRRGGCRPPQPQPQPRRGPLLQAEVAPLGCLALLPALGWRWRRLWLLSAAFQLEAQRRNGLQVLLPAAFCLGRRRGNFNAAAAAAASADGNVAPRAGSTAAPGASAFLVRQQLSHLLVRTSWGQYS